MYDRFGAMAQGSATTRPVGRWSDVLHAFAVSQFLRVRFEVVLVALLGVVNGTAVGDRRVGVRRSVHENPSPRCCCNVEHHVATCLDFMLNQSSDRGIVE